MTDTAPRIDFANLPAPAEGILVTLFITSRGRAEIDRGAEIRCYMRDPDGYLIEVGQSTGLLQGRLAKRPTEPRRGQLRRARRLRLLRHGAFRRAQRDE